jgi:microcystin-dependent protein
MEPFVGEIKIFGGNFAPRGYASCDGQLLSIAQNTALFSILGTTFGGDGQTTFGVPSLQGRMPVHYGQGPGLPQIDLGEVVGQSSVSLTVGEMPAHTHAMTATMNVVSGAGTSVSPADGYVAGDAGGDANYAPSSVQPSGTAAPGALTVTCGIAGGGLPVSIQTPGLGVNIIIALEGVFPTRN